MIGRANRPLEDNEGRLSVYTRVDRNWRVFYDDNWIIFDILP